jgi:hypothetical protein
MNYLNHLSAGNSIVMHKEKKIPISDPEALKQLLDSVNVDAAQVAYVPAGYEHRPDLISDYFYNTVNNDWLIMMYNNISDPLQQLNVGDRILIPII